ncbi:MAG: hypothetical protein AAB920_03875 [Patescibacteria group bacterium]
MGFLAKSELTHEIGERLFLNHEHSRALANEINARIFDSVKEELEEAYNPYGDETEATEESEKTTTQPNNEEVATETKVESVGLIGEKIQVSAIGTEDTEPVSLPIHEEGGPMVLQKSGSFFEKPAERTEKRRSPIPFNMFASSPESTEAKPAVKVKIETPHAFSWPFEKKKDEEKVVHYSEIRSSSSPLSQTPEGLIHLEALQNISTNDKRPTTYDNETEKISPVVTPSIAGSIDALQSKAPETASTPTVVDTSALNESVKEEGRRWSLKSIFNKKREEKKISVADKQPKIYVPAEHLPEGGNLKPTTSQPVPITISAVPAKLPNTQTKGAEYAPKENGPALEGNVVHLK